MCQIGYVELYDLYNVIELDNNTLLSCNSIGIKLYNKFSINIIRVTEVISMNKNYMLYILFNKRSL